MSALDDGIYRIRNHEPSGVVSAETLATLMEKEYHQLKQIAEDYSEIFPLYKNALKRIDWLETKADIRNE